MENIVCSFCCAREGQRQAAAVSFLPALQPRIYFLRRSLLFGFLSRLRVWIPGPRPLDSTASVYTNSRSHPRSVTPFRVDPRYRPTFLGPHSTSQPHRKKINLLEAPASSWRRRKLGSRPCPSCGEDRGRSTAIRGSSYSCLLRFLTCLSSAMSHRKLTFFGETK